MKRFASMASAAALAFNLLAVPAGVSAAPPEPSGVVSGTVTDGAGNPLTGVLIDSYRWDNGEHAQLTTAGDGTYSAVGAPGTVTFYFSLTGYLAPCWDEGFAGCKHVDIMDGATTTLDVQLLGEARLVGTVLDSAGSPVEGVTVSAAEIVIGGGTTIPTTTTAADGTYTLFPVLPISQPVRFVPPSGSGLHPTSLDATPPEGGELVLDAALRIGGTISGHITNTAGSAASGAWVTARNALDFYDATAVQADANGDYSIIGLTPGDYTVDAYDATSAPTFYPGVDRAAAQLVTIADVFDGVSYPSVNGTDIALLAMPSGTVEVLDQYGAPPDAAEFAVCDAPAVPDSLSMETCAGGPGGASMLRRLPAGAVDNLTPGSYHVQAMAGGVLVGPVTPLTVQAGQTFDCVLRYEEDPSQSSCTTHNGPTGPSQVTITGRLVSSIGGVGVEGTVSAFQLSIVTPATYFDTFATQPDGSFSITVPYAQQWHLEGLAPGYVPLWGSYPLVNTHLPAGGTYDIGDVVVEPLGEVTGIVTDGSGAPVQGVVVDVYHWPSGMVEHELTDVDGRYTASLRAGSTTAIFSKVGYIQPCWAAGFISCKTQSIVIGAPTTLNVTMYREATVAGTVTDTNGNPVGGVMVADGAFYGNQLTTVTAADGTYTLDGVVPVSQTFIFDPPSGSGLMRVSPVIAPVEAGNQVLDVVLPVGGSISGRITNFEGTPMGGLTVWASNDDASMLAETDAAGEYTVTGLPPGDYTVGLLTEGGSSVYYPGVMEFANAEVVTVADVFDGVGYPAVTGIDIERAPMAIGTVQLLNAAGDPPGWGGVAVCPAGYTPSPDFFAFQCDDGNGSVATLQAVVAGSNGSATIDLAPGSYTLQTALLGFFTGPVVPLTVQSGQTFACAVRYEEAAGLSSCSVSGTPIPVDGDGVPAAIEDGAPNSGDGNADGTPDAEQMNVSSLPSPTSGYVTVAGPTGTELNAVTAQDASALPAAPGTGPSAVVGYTLDLNGVPSPVTVEVIVDDPPPTINSFFKYHDGAWVDATSLVSAFTPLGDGRTKVTLVLTDGAFGDADGVVNGAIVDPGLFSTMSTPSYTFDGFSWPLNRDGVRVLAGSTMALRYRVTTADGVPVTDRSSFVAITASACGGGAAIDVTSRTRLLRGANGRWTVQLRTSARWRGCYTLTLSLADGSTHSVSVRFVTGGHIRHWLFHGGSHR